jgi:hypothetical protein
MKDQVEHQEMHRESLKTSSEEKTTRKMKINTRAITSKQPFVKEAVNNIAVISKGSGAHFNICMHDEEIQDFESL